MTAIQLDNLFIHSVYQKQVDERTIEIYFTVEDYPYILSVYKRYGYDDCYSPWATFHATDDLCPLCRIQKKELKCQPLSGMHLLPLFHRLIAQPGIRLEWIFYTYEEKEGEEHV